MNEDAECEKSLTPQDVRSSIFDQTYEGTYEHKKYESNVRLNKAIRNISSTTDQSIKIQPIHSCSQAEQNAVRIHI